jgi:thiamine monophosphate synthase
VAIGGIDASNAGELALAGIDAVAVIAAVFAHDDPRDVADAARAIAAAFRLPSPPR